MGGWGEHIQPVASACLIQLLSQEPVFPHNYAVQSEGAAVEPVFGSMVTGAGQVSIVREGTPQR